MLCLRYGCTVLSTLARVYMYGTYYVPEGTRYGRCEYIQLYSYY
jgi:hypothetical protein